MAETEQPRADTLNQRYPQVCALEVMSQLSKNSETLHSVMADIRVMTTSTTLQYAQLVTLITDVKETLKRHGERIENLEKRVTAIEPVKLAFYSGCALVGAAILTAILALVLKGR